MPQIRKNFDTRDAQLAYFNKMRENLKHVNKFTTSLPDGTIQYVVVHPVEQNGTVE